MKTKYIQSRNAVKFMTIIACVCLLLLLTKCKRERNENHNPKFNNMNYTSNPVASDEFEIEKQMRWIAKGYAYVYDTLPDIFDFLHNHISSTNYYEDAHQIINPAAISLIFIDLDDEVLNAVNLIDINNDYNKDFFMGFEYNDCIHLTMINIVDEEYSNTNFPVLFTYEDANEGDSTWGYFWDNGIDSVLLTSQNFEDYFIFGIYPKENCNRFERRAGRSCESGCCNYDGVCEPMQGETVLNCPDCQGTFLPFEKELKVEWIRIDEDKHPFDEAWISGKYEIIWDFVIAQGTEGRIQNNRKPNLNDPNSHNFDLFGKWRRKEVPVNRKNLKGSVTIKEYSGISKVMYKKFNYTVHDIYISITELDFRKRKSDIIQNENNEDIELSSKYHGVWTLENIGGTFHKGGIFDWGGLIYIPANSTWGSEIIDGEPHKTLTACTPHGEITIKLSYKE
jgi:hypothetical protein